MLYKDELSLAWHDLENLKWLNAARTEERRVLQKKLCLQIRTCRFAGDFTRAKALVKELLAEELLGSIAPYCLLDLVCVYCESQEVDIAKQVIPRGILPDYSLLNLGSTGRRVRHAPAVC